MVSAWEPPPLGRAVIDNGGTFNGGQDTDQSPNTITFNVTPVNDAPDGTDKTITILEDSPRSFSAADFGFTDVLDNNSLNRVEADKSLKVLADGMPGGADGLENVGGDDFLVSVWSGAVWYVPASGDKQLLFDGKPTETRTADMAWDPQTKTAYVPTFFKNSVVAYKVE